MWPDRLLHSDCEVDKVVCHLFDSVSFKDSSVDCLKRCQSFFHKQFAQQQLPRFLIRCGRELSLRCHLKQLI